MNMLALQRRAPYALAALLLAATLYAITIVYAAGETLLAVTMLAITALAAWIYSAARAYAFRYLFPGIAAALIFVVFPMLYTTAIGFTNYSSRNLLDFDRATQYLLDETYSADGAAFAFTLHRDGDRYRLRLENGDDGSVFVTKPIGLVGETPVEIAAESAQSNAALPDPVPFKDLIGLQKKMQALKVRMPAGTVVQMTGLREFAPVRKLYERTSDGGLVNKQTGAALKPNFATGFYETAAGERVPPGFRVGIGWDNYQRIFTDRKFQEPFVRIFLWTVAFSALTVFFGCALGMLLAVLFNWDSLKGKGIYRTLLFIPYAVPGFISILVFKGLFNNNFGEINLILDALFRIKPAWFSVPLLAKTMLLIVNVWLGYPYMMVICMGLIKAIPADLYEASAVAGVGPLTNFFRITLPLILKPLTPLLISAFAFNFNNFVLIALLTGGRPDFLDTSVPAGTTDLLVSYTYRIAFQDSGQQFGLAAAISTAIFAMVAVISLVQMRFTRIAREEAH
ncbi:MAG TPA: maltose ABC transporter permease MalF [Burkholderiaceae bacterium]